MFQVLWSFFETLWQFLSIPIVSVPLYYFVLPVPLWIIPLFLGVLFFTPVGNWLAYRIWGKFESRDELRKFFVLATIFFCIIGVYWALRPLKDSIFVSMVGKNWIPWAKALSVSLLIPLVILYTKLIDTYKRDKVFYIMMFSYGIITLIFYFLLSNSQYGIPNTVESPFRILGWLWYAFVESFGSLLVALFWVFTTDITLPDSAKRGFPIIALLGQLGNIVGPLVLRAERFGFENSAPIAAICGGIMFFIGFLMWLFMRTTPKKQMQSYVVCKGSVSRLRQGSAGQAAKASSDKKAEKCEEREKKEAVGFLDGLKLIFTKKYLLGIFIIVASYEAILVIFDYHFKVLVADEFPISMPRAEALRANYLADYGVWTGIVSSLCVLFGINSIQRKLGMRASLILSPILVAIAAVTVKFFPELSVIFWIMVIAKAVNYALNAPTVKQLYIPTTKEARYKSQGWIEMFGSRAAKFGGSMINMTRGVFEAQYGPAVGISFFLSLTTIASLGIVCGWLFVALFVAKMYNDARAKDQYVV